MNLTSVELCAGAGGQALGLEQSGFVHDCLVEIERDACATLRLNRPDWNVKCMDIKEFDARKFRDADLLAGGLPCPPFSVAGKQLGENDERNLFPTAIRIVDEIRPSAVMIENVKGILEPSFEEYREHIRTELRKLGYVTNWKLLNACDFGVSQLRPRVVFVALKTEFAQNFQWPEPLTHSVPTVGELLVDLMAENGWEGAKDWMNKANEIAPTIVGGSKKHGGPDLGPTRSRKSWSNLGVNGGTVSLSAPMPGFDGDPTLSLRMVARIQGFPDDWIFAGTKTSAYRQIGNAFPPPVAKAVSQQIFDAIKSTSRSFFLT